MNSSNYMRVKKYLLLKEYKSNHYSFQQKLQKNSIVKKAYNRMRKQKLVLRRK